MPDTIRDPVDWPLLLLGPMLRKVTTEAVHVFVATREPVNSARLVLYEGRIPSSEQTVRLPYAESPPTPLRRIGAKLHVGLLRAEMPVGFDPGPEDLFSYDIELDFVTEGFKNLETLRLLGGTSNALQDAAPLGYEAGYLPCFLFPPEDIADLRLSHASCRKPHGGGKGEPDALPILDAVVQDSLGLVAAPRPTDFPVSNHERPHQLVLTGDQIYADDVAASLLQALGEAGGHLLGWTEDIPAVTPTNAFLLWPGWRTRLLSFAGVKDIPDEGGTDYSANHLVRFAEWCAMYIFAWSDSLWARNDDGDGYELPWAPYGTVPEEVESIKTVIDLAGYIPGVQLMSKEASFAWDTATWLNQFQWKLERDWSETRDMAKAYAPTTRFVRRLLANVPTYTMFDDHEITDDWFLNQHVVDRQLGNETTVDWAGVGPRLLRNGLSAYAIFQHWGNSPEDFESGRHGDTLISKWEAAVDSAAGLRGSPGDADTLLGIDAARAGGAPLQPDRHSFDRIRWDYAISFRAHRLLVLDTRTWRAFPDLPMFDEAALAALPGPSTSGDDGTAVLSAIAAVWRDVAGPVSNAGGDWADLIDACAAVPSATTFEDAVDLLDDVGAAVETLNSKISGSAEVSTIVSEWRNTEIPALTSLQSSFFSVAHFLLRLSRVWWLFPQDWRLRKAIRELGEHAAAWASDSYRGIVDAVDTFHDAASGDLWLTFTPFGSDSTSFDAAMAAIRPQIEALRAALPQDMIGKTVFRDGTNRMGAALISTDALGFMVTDAIAETGGASPPTFMLSPAPIFGHEMVEIVQRIMLIKATFGGLPGAEEMDYEAWSVNAPALIDLFVAAKDLTHCIVLSGDVHYANSSVRELRLSSDDGDGPLLTRWIQLTSSAGRNADAMTRGLAAINDIVTWEQDTGVQQVQLPGGAHLGPTDTAGWFGEVFLEKLRDTGEALEFLIEDALQGAWYSHHPYALAVKMWDERKTIADLAAAVLKSPVNSASAWGTEAVWKLMVLVRAFDELAEDPSLAVFGEYLYLRDVVHEQLVQLHKELGVDPHGGLRVDGALLMDRRPSRMELYRVKTRYAAEHAHNPKILEYADAMEMVTVGSANVGLVRFEMDDDARDEIRGVSHELLWYPLVDLKNDPSTHEPVVVPLPRTDWIGTLHRAAWNDPAYDLGKLDG